MTDDFTSRFLDPGQTYQPHTFRCLKCARKALTAGNPMASMFLTAYPVALPDSESSFVLCGPCAIALGEWLNPALLDDAAYIAKKDQHDAATTDMRRRLGLPEE